MRKHFALLILLLTALGLCSCGLVSSGDDSSDPRPDGSVSMIALIDSIDGDMMVTVLESEYTSGPHLVHVTPATKLLGKGGEIISLSDFKVGDKVKILYSGQVMLSYPPQIVAAEIALQ